MFKHNLDKEQMSSKTKVKSENKYSDEKNKERDLAPRYLMRMYLDQFKIFQQYKDIKVSQASLLRFLIDSYDILELFLKNGDAEFNINTENWSNEDFNQFYDYMKKFSEYTLKLGGDNK